MGGHCSLTRYKLDSWFTHSLEWVDHGIFAMGDATVRLCATVTVPAVRDTFTPNAKRVWEFLLLVMAGERGGARKLLSDVPASRRKFAWEDVPDTPAILCVGQVAYFGNSKKSSVTGFLKSGLLWEDAVSVEHIVALLRNLSAWGLKAETYSTRLVQVMDVYGLEDAGEWAADPATADGGVGGQEDGSGMEVVQMEAQQGNEVEALGIEAVDGGVEPDTLDVGQGQDGGVEELAVAMQAIEVHDGRGAALAQGDARQMTGVVVGQDGRGGDVAQGACEAQPGSVQTGLQPVPEDGVQLAGGGVLDQGAVCVQPSQRTRPQRTTRSSSCVGCASGDEAEADGGTKRKGRIASAAGPGRSQQETEDDEGQSAAAVAATTIKSRAHHSGAAAANAEVRMRGHKRQK